MNLKKQNKRIILIGGLIFFIFALSACNLERAETGETQTKNEVVEVGNAEKAVIDITMGIGDLTVGGGAADLMDAEFKYNVPDWEPDVSYEVSGSNGRLNVTQPEGDYDLIPNSNIEYSWNLQFNEEIPMEMDVTMGVGESELNLDSLNLSRLSVETGAGQADIVLGNSPLRIVDIKAGVGAVALDLSNEWQEDTNISIESGVGDMTILLPTDVGVIVDADVALGDFEANGFIVQGDNYVNEAYGDSSTTLSIELTGGIGGVTLQLEE